VSFSANGVEVLEASLLRGNVALPSLFLRRYAS
jgi:hypothetical protein